MDKNIKLIALDMDGTILDDQGNFSKKTALKLKDLIDQGIHVVFATGRTHRSAYRVMKKMGLGEIPIISHNGSKAVLPEFGELFNKKMAAQDARVILGHGDKEGLYNKAYIDDVMYIKDHRDDAEKFAKNHGIGYEIIGELGENIPGDVNMIIFIYPEPVEIDYPGLFEDLDVSITRSMPQAYEFMAKGTNKGQALKKVADYYGIQKDQILAAGNALNDLEMLSYAGVGVAMKNSDPNLLKVWDQVSAYSNNEEGVYELIKDLGGKR